MKVIGMVNSGTYLCEVTHDELEQSVDLYYGKMKALKVGDTMNLGAGHDFRGDIQHACRGLLEGVSGFSRAQRSLIAFARMVTDLHDEVAAPDPE